MPSKTTTSTRSHMPGNVAICVDCGKRTLAWTDALQETIAVPGRVVILKGLTGHKCSNCGLEMMDLGSAAEVERERANAIPANFEVAVVKQHDRRGVFLTKDLVRLTNAGEAKTAIITPIDGTHLLVELKPAED